MVKKKLIKREVVKMKKCKVYCSKCGSDNIVVYQRRKPYSKDYEYYIHCHECNITGWNGRIKKWIR